MTPFYDDRFNGHIEAGDPRGPLSAAGGCVWPTIPAYRYWLKSDDASGDLAFFNTNPPVLQFVSPQPAHDIAGWTLHIANPFVHVAVAVKTFVHPNNTYTWTFIVFVNAIPEAPLEFGVIRNAEPCNIDIPLPNVWAFDIDRGQTGDTFRMEQIEWDKESPPS